MIKQTIKQIADAKVSKKENKIATIKEYLLSQGFKFAKDRYGYELNTKLGIDLKVHFKPDYNKLTIETEISHGSTFNFIPNSKDIDLNEPLEKIKEEIYNFSVSMIEKTNANPITP